MDKKIELNEELDKILGIFFLCKESYLIVRELYKTSDTSNYLIDIKYKGSFFNLTKVNYWRIVVLQLYKLYTEKERFNIIKLLSKFEKSNYFGSLNIDQNFIKSELSKIYEKQKSIDAIKIQRDKIFAHEDGNTNIIIDEITLDQAKELIDLCQSILSEIFNVVFSASYDFEMTNSAILDLKKILISLDTLNTIKAKEEKEFFQNYIEQQNKYK